MTTYETPRITDYGTLAELTRFDAASGGVLVGHGGLSLSGVPNTSPGGGTDLPPSHETAPPPPPASPPGGEVTTTAPPPPPAGELHATAASATGPVPTSGAGELQSAVPTGAEGATATGAQLASASPSGPGSGPGPDAAPGDAGSATTPEATISPGDLPFTGGAVGLVAALGGVLTATGAALRRAVKRH